MAFAAPLAARGSRLAGAQYPAADARSQTSRNANRVAAGEMRRVGVAAADSIQAQILIRGGEFNLGAAIYLISSRLATRDSRL